MTSEADRRRLPRFKVSVPVQLSSGEHVFRGVLKDLCREAALVGIKDGLDMGSAVSLILQLPGTGGPLQIGGKVVRVSAGEPTPSNPNESSGSPITRSIACCSAKLRRSVRSSLSATVKAAQLCVLT